MSNLNGDNQQSTKPTAAGCIIKATDSYSIISSLACFASFIVYGACNASLGAAVPIISRTVYKSESYVGFSFITRGIGFLCSTVLSGLFLSIYDKSNWKEYYVCIFTLVMGIATVMIGYNKNYLLLLLLTVVQGIGYGVVDTVGNCLLPELWGIRVQPWMQFLHLCFGIGAIIGPSMIGYFGFKPSYLYIGIMSVVPLLFLLLSRILSANYKISDKTSGRSMVSIDDNDDHDATTVDDDDDDDDYENEKSMGDIDSGGDGILQHTVDYNIPVPTKLRMLIATFYFIYAGTEASFGGWISVYAMNAGVTSDPSAAAYIATIFWLTLTIGRIVGVFTAIYLSATFMLRLHLMLTVVFSILVLMISGLSFTSCYIVSASMGLGVSAIYPLAMTVVSDYGYTMDSTSTTMFMLGAVFGEGLLPMMMGLVIAYYGPTGFPVGIVVSSSVLVLIYVAVDMVGGIRVNSSSTISMSNGRIGSRHRGSSGSDDAVTGVLYHSVTMKTLNDKQNSDSELTE